MDKKNAVLFLIATIVAGFAWVFIPSQSEHVLPEFSIFYRFIMACSLLFLVSWKKDLIKKMTLHEHIYLAIAGISMYGIFCSLVYRATFYLPTGMIALFVSLMVIPATIFEFFITRAQLTKSFFVCLVCSISGCFIIFSKDFSLSHEKELYGVMLSTIAIVVYALGSFLTRKIPHSKVSKIYQTGVAMLYGAIFSLILGFILSRDIALQFDMSQKYIISLTLLGVLFTPVVFAIFLYLVEQIGQTKASFIWVGMTILALVISMIFEGLSLTREFVIGIIIIMFGLIAEKTKIFDRKYEKK